MTRQESQKRESKWCHKAGANTPCSKNALAPCQVFCTHPPHPPNRKCKQINLLVLFCVPSHLPPKKKHIPSQTTTNDNQRQRQPTTLVTRTTRWPKKNLHTWHSSRVPLDESTQNALRQGASWRVKNKDLQLMRQLHSRSREVQGAVLQKKDAERMFFHATGGVPLWMEV